MRKIIILKVQKKKKRQGNLERRYNYKTWEESQTMEIGESETEGGKGREQAE